MAQSTNRLTPTGYLRLSELVRQTVETIHGPWAVAGPVERVEKRVSFQGEDIIFEYVSRDGMPEMPLESEKQRWSSARAHIHQALLRGELISFTQSTAGNVTQIDATFWEASKCGEVLEFGNIEPGKMGLDGRPVLVNRENADLFLEHIGHVERDGIRPEFFEAYDWTALQTVAWIYTRDRDLICQLSPTRETFGWRLCDYRVPGHDEIKTGQLDNDPPTAADIFMKVLDIEPCPFSSLEAAETELISACRAEKIKGFGLENGAGEPKEIPAIHWSKIKFTWSDRPRDETQPDRAGSWAHPTFEREAVLNLWREDWNEAAADQETLAPSIDDTTKKAKPGPRPGMWRRELFKRFEGMDREHLENEAEKMTKKGEGGTGARKKNIENWRACLNAKSYRDNKSAPQNNSDLGRHIDEAIEAARAKLDAAGK